MRNNRAPGPDMRKKIEEYSYGLNDIIGRGFSSMVFWGINEKTHEKVAIKVIDMKSIRDNNTAKTMLDGEISALKQLNHQNIMRCYDIYTTANNCYIITEFCNEGDLEHLLKKRDRLPEAESIPIFRDIILGFKQIIEKGYLHRDLKPANIFLKDKIAKIGDFGFTKKTSNKFKQTSNVGSPLYMSPESLKKSIYSVKSDIWSMGVIFYETLHGKVPWQCTTEAELAQKITKNQFQIDRNISEDLKDFIRQCLTAEEEKRISFQDFFYHPFVKRITENDGIPQLLRKNTSAFQNQNIPSQKEIPNPPNIQNFKSKEVTNIHHRKNTSSEGDLHEKLISTHINWMKYLHRLLESFESTTTESSLKFIIVKQLFGQESALNESFEGENPFNIYAWDELKSKNEKCLRMKGSVSEFNNKCVKPLRGCFSTWISKLAKSKEISRVVDENCERSEYLSMLAVKLALDQCCKLWESIKREVSLLGEREGELPKDLNQKSQCLDFLMTYYQLNCLLLDNFNDPEYFCRMSKLDQIMSVRPAQFEFDHLKDLHHKLQVLELRQ